MTAAEVMVMQALAKAHPGRDDLGAVMATWEIVPYLQEGELVAASCVKGTEFHCLTTPAFKLRRRQLREYLRPLHARHGMLTTRVQHDDVGNQRFNALFGFRRTWSDATFHYYIMAELPFGGEKK